MSSTFERSPACPNCGSTRAGPYCSQCGQNDRSYQRSLPPLVWDLLREAFELDSRLVRTIRFLLLKPGQLAVEFSRNRRASYVSPIRLYLFVSLFFFFLLSLSADLQPGWRDAAVIRDAQAQALEGGNAEQLQQVLGETRRAKIDEILARPENSPTRVALMELARSVDERGEPLDRPRLYLLAQTVDVIHDPIGAFNQLVDNLPIVVFLMLPVFALVLSLFYLKRRYYVENLVFATHLHSFGFLVFAVELLLPTETAVVPLNEAMSVLGNMLIAGLAVYHYLALRRYYEEGRLKTVFKFLGQMTVYFSLVLPVAFVLVALVTLATV